MKFDGDRDLIQNGNRLSSPANSIDFAGMPIMSAVSPLQLSTTPPGESRKRFPTLFAAGLLRAGNTFRFDDRGASSLAELLERPLDAVLILENDLGEAFQESAPALLELVPAEESAVIVLIARRPPPLPQFRPDGPVFSFICAPGVLKQVVANCPGAKARDLCFELLHQILNGSIQDVDRLLVRQIPEENCSSAAPSAGLPVALVMAHRGEQRYLDTALRYLSKANGAELRVRVGLDVERPEDYKSLMQCHPATDFYRVKPAPVGPYVIRQELAARSPEPLLALQDSDDLSCYNRFALLSREIATTGCEMVGSHELRVDEIERQVIAVRFPLDATAALRERNVFALLHATLMIKRKAFFSAGGLSTDQIVANDTQFLMRAFFHFRIRNVDEFLYIRRRHHRALTIAPETAAGNELRMRLDNQWTLDFEAVKRGELSLDESSLRPMHGTVAYSIEPIVLNGARPAVTFLPVAAK